MGDVILFALFGAGALVGAGTVVAARDPFISALALILNFASLGALYLVLHAPFVAAAQIIVYAGAVVVLFLFVLAYLGGEREIVGKARRGRWIPVVGLVAALGLAEVIAIAVVQDKSLGSGFGKVAAEFGSPAEIGVGFLTVYLLEFELTSLVLLVAAIGGIVLGLTGRARHGRLRQALGAHSADQQRRDMDRQLRSMPQAGGLQQWPPASRPKPREPEELR